MIKTHKGCGGLIKEKKGKKTILSICETCLKEIPTEEIEEIGLAKSAVKMSTPDTNRSIIG